MGNDPEHQGGGFIYRLYVHICSRVERTNKTLRTQCSPPPGKHRPAPSTREAPAKRTGLRISLSNPRTPHGHPRKRVGSIGGCSSEALISAGWGSTTNPLWKRSLSLLTRFVFRVVTVAAEFGACRRRFRLSQAFARPNALHRAYMAH